jgi:GNAT superfamily N-acetyltransferase
MAGDSGGNSREPSASEVVLRDGSAVTIRPVRACDEGRLLTFLRGLSLASLRYRYFSAGVDLVAEARRDARAGERGQFGLVATTGRDGHIVGHAVYGPTGAGRAEAGLVVADSWQGRGLGTLLLGRLAREAAAVGIRAIETDILAENRPMLEVLRHLASPLEASWVSGERLLVFDSTGLAQAVARLTAPQSAACAVSYLPAGVGPGAD